MALGQLGRHDEAIAAIERALALTPSSAITLALRAQALALAGDRRGARAQLNELAARVEHVHLLPQLMAATCVAIDSQDEAWRWLQMAVDRRCYTLIWLRVDPWFDRVRDDPRFRVTLARIGLPDGMLSRK